MSEIMPLYGRCITDPIPGLLIKPRLIDIALIGPPRCGTNWLRYIVEKISKKGVFSHTGFPNSTINKLIMILRNPKESMPRHMGSGVERVKKIKYKTGFFERYSDVIEKNFKCENIVGDYVYPISFFESCEASKLLIYYEDLISKHEEVINNIASFLNVSIGSFLLDYEEHKRKSIEKYNENFQSVTEGKAALYHSLKVPKELNDKVDNMIANQSEQIKKYIKHYIGG